MRILIAEDNAHLLKTLSRILKKEGYTVDAVSEGNSALEYMKSCDYDGVVLDIMMPGMDGISVLRQARASNVASPVMFLSALSDVSKRVEGLEAGADDYLPKPFAAAEFVARVHAMLRRRSSYTPQISSFAGVSLDGSTRQLSYGESAVMLGNKEFQIMELLMSKPGAIIPIEVMLSHAWNWDNKADSSVVWVQVSNLRKKLCKIDPPVSIRFVRGAGYVLEEVKGDEGDLDENDAQADVDAPCAATKEGSDEAKKPLLSKGFERDGANN